MYIPPIIIHHLIKMTKDGLVKQIAIQKSLGPDDDWPPEFDPNDIPIYEIILKELHAASNDAQRELDLGGGKICLFFMLMIPDYAREI